MSDAISRAVHDAICDAVKITTPENKATFHVIFNAMFEGVRDKTRRTFNIVDRLADSAALMDGE